MNYNASRPVLQIQYLHASSYLFVVSHMRSFSTLLCHILGSHSDIGGYVETHQSYFGGFDLDRLAVKVTDTTEDPLLRRYLLDKMLHNYVHIAPKVLARPDVKILFLIRSAEDTIRSILNLFLGGQRSGWSACEVPGS